MIDDLVFGLSQTFLLFLIAWAGGFPTGVILAGAGHLLPTTKLLLRMLAMFASAIPLLVVLFWFHYPLQFLLDVVWPPFFTASLVLVIYVTLVTADIISDSLSKVDVKYHEVANVLGIRTSIYLREILFPTALYISIPRFLALAIMVIHATMFTSLIGVEELFRVIQRLNAQTLQPVMLFTIMAASYAFLTVPIYLLTTRFERRIMATFSHA